MVDRLSDLKGMQEMEVEEGDIEAQSDHEDHASDEEEEGGNDFMPEFFRDVSTIKGGMATIRRNIKAIEDCYGQALAALSPDQAQKSSEEMERLIDATNKSASDVRNKLKEMDAENKQLSSKDKGQEPAKIRIRQNMHATLTKKFLELMSQYQEVQTKFKNKYRERVERQYLIVKPDATSEEIDQIMDSGEAQAIFARQILDLERHAKAKDALAYIENRHRDILKLEQSINELHKLFVDMAILIETQGEMIDQIEANIEASVGFTGKAVEELQKANKYQKKSRKKMCIIIIILLVVFILLGGGGIIAGVKA